MPHFQCFAHSFIFSSHLATGLASSPSFLSFCCTPPLYAVGFVQKPCTPVYTLDHVTDFFLMFMLHFFTSHNQSYPFLHNIFPPEWSHAFSQSTASNSLTHQLLVASFLPFAPDFPYHILHSFHSLLLLRFFHFCRAQLHALLSLQIVLSEPKENSCPAVFTPFAKPIFLASSYQSTLGERTSSFVSFSFAVLHLGLIQNVSAQQTLRCHVSG